MRMNDNKLYYMPQWDLFGVSKRIGKYTFLITSEFNEKSNIYRVLTNKWILIGEL